LQGFRRLTIRPTWFDFQFSFPGHFITGDAAPATERGVAALEWRAGSTMSAPDFTTPKAPTFLRLSAGFVYFYFGFLKFFPDLSPGELIAGQTLMRFSLHWLDAATALWWLAVIECLIGLSFLFNFGMKYVFFLFMAHQVSTFLPLFLFPEITFKFVPFAPTLEGQYIFKNLISLAAGWTVMWPVVKAGWRRQSGPKIVPMDAADRVTEVGHARQLGNIVG
jgi:hypothetical protein